MRYCWAQCVKARSKSELLRVNLDIKILKEIFCSIEHLLNFTINFHVSLCQFFEN